MSWKRALCMAWVVALTACTAGNDSAGDLAIKPGGLVLAAGETAYWPISAGDGGGMCSPYALAAYENHATGCGGVLSVMPSSKDRVVYEPQPGLDHSDRLGPITFVR